VQVALTDDGVALGADVIPARGDRRGVAVLLHAMMVDRRSFRGEKGLPGVLAGAGFEVWCADLRGRGLSPSGPWTYDDLVRRDIPALLSAARARADGGSVVVVGHSLGAHTTVAAAASGLRPDKLVAIAGNVWMPSLEPSRRRRAAKAASMAAFLLSARAAGRFPSRRVRMGPVDEALPYVEDLVRFWREDRWASRDGEDWFAAMPSVDLPVLSVLGAGDRLMAHPVGATNWARRLPGAEVRVVGRRTGLPFDPGHMALVTDMRSAPVWESIASWLTL
jgi:predicted alpha/beta hydrolase